MEVMALRLQQQQTDQSLEPWHLCIPIPKDKPAEIQALFTWHPAPGLASTHTMDIMNETFGAQQNGFFIWK